MHDKRTMDGRVDEDDASNGSTWSVSLSSRCLSPTLWPPWRHACCCVLVHSRWQAASASPAGVDLSTTNWSSAACLHRRQRTLAISLNPIVTDYVLKSFHNFWVYWCIREPRPLGSAPISFHQSSNHDTQGLKDSHASANILPLSSPKQYLGVHVCAQYRKRGVS